MKKKKNIFLQRHLIILIFLFQNTIVSARQKSDMKISIVTTLFPLYDFAKNIGKEKIKVILLLPPGIETHTFEPKPSDILKINQADILIYTGDFMEPWVKNIIQIIDTKKVKIINTSKNTMLLHRLPSKDQKETYIHKACCSNTINTVIDPHIWLDFDNSKIMIETIKNALSQTDPENANYYEKNASDYITQIDKLDLLYKEKLKKCRSKKFVYDGHYAFGYLAKRYNLEYTASQGILPESELSAHNLILIIEKIKKKKIKYIFCEENSNTKISNTIATETGVKLLFLNAAHNVSKNSLSKDISYISIMTKNLESLCIGLEYNV